MKRTLYLLPLLAAIALALVFQPAQAQTETPPPTPTPIPEGDSDIPLVHIVQSGETLTTIAEQYGTTVEVLQQLNNISDPELLFAGQELIVPGGGGTAVALSYTVKVGDNLQGIASDFNTTRAAIAETNRGFASRLRGVTEDSGAVPLNDSNRLDCSHGHWRRTDSEKQQT